ncbi:serine/threonine-protein kinase [Glaciihabitans sp. UYNi722]|uniref:serine/threonine-protein kinase n=1 Tax=Glaciihabitans sp. UYNi722 TaxID=3156344 RepID=UPI00339161F7
MRRPSSQPPELPGYTYVKVLGSGGFSDVFLYEQKLPKRRVAVKVLLTEELTVANRASFAAEANLMAQLSTHPYIVTIYQADVAADDRPYFVMEYCSGPSLAERYKQSTFEVSDALRTGVRLSSAVATAHSAGILHRDIKPANVLTNDYGWPALTDFGISSAVDDELLPVHTGTLADALNDTGSGSTGSQSIGMSVPWSPPEMFEDDPDPDVSSDVFSLAATIYTILAGQTPFEVRGRSNGTLDLIGRIERGAITPMTRDDVPQSLLAVLKKGMASDRADRFATAVDFARALQRVELELGYAPTTIDVPNLLIQAPDRAGAEDDDDATRARSVSTIAVQEMIRPPIAAPHAIQPPQQEAPIEATRIRGAVPVDQTVRRPRTRPTPPAPGPAVVDVASEAEGQETVVPVKRRLGLIIGSVVGILVMVGVVLAIVIPASLPGPQPDPGSASGGTGGGVIDVPTVPKPELVSSAASADGTSVTFTWKNPKPKKDDSFLWAMAEAPSKKTPTAEAQAVVTGVVPGSRVCINVEVLRDGKTSPNPLEVCNP